jgi:hypothetical protein
MLGGMNLVRLKAGAGLTGKRAGADLVGGDVAALIY